MSRRVRIVLSQRNDADSKELLEYLESQLSAGKNDKADSGDGQESGGNESNTIADEKLETDVKRQMAETLEVEADRARAEAKRKGLPEGSSMVATPKEILDERERTKKTLAGHRAFGWKLYEVTVYAIAKAIAEVLKNDGG
jgi:hypothetical protein